MSYFDLRGPLGWLFVILGGLLICSGFQPQVTSEGVALGTNIDWIWGGVMIAFGLICLWLCRRQSRRHEGSRPQS